MKYYTPTIEEFHVGFEYERPSTISGKWTKSIFKNRECAEQYCKPEEGRVKYLDKEDIEELGWTIITITEDEIIATKRNGYYRLIKNIYGLTIDNGLKWELNEQYFSGTIKNKSELKKLMKQLCI